MTGQQRLTFGSLQLADGIDVVIVAVGLFAIGEALWVAAASAAQAAASRSRSAGPGWAGPTCGGPGSRGCADPLIGFPFGAIPAGGAEIPTFLSYVTEKRLSKHKDEFGKGAIEGVAGPESAASASAAGHAGLDADAGPADDGGRRRDAGRVPAVRHPARARCSSSGSRTWCGA